MAEGGRRLIHGVPTAARCLKTARLPPLVFTPPSPPPPPYAALVPGARRKEDVSDHDGRTSPVPARPAAQRPSPIERPIESQTRAFQRPVAAAAHSSETSEWDTPTFSTGARFSTGALHGRGHGPHVTGGLIPVQGVEAPNAVQTIHMFSSLFGFPLGTSSYQRVDQAASGGTSGSRDHVRDVLITQLSPEQVQQAWLSRLLLLLGSFVILCLLLF